MEEAGYVTLVTLGRLTCLRSSCPDLSGLEVSPRAEPPYSSQRPRARRAVSASPRYPPRGLDAGPHLNRHSGPAPFQWHACPTLARARNTLNQPLKAGLSPSPNLHPRKVWRASYVGRPTQKKSSLSKPSSIPQPSFLSPSPSSFFPAKQTNLHFPLSSPPLQSPRRKVGLWGASVNVPVPWRTDSFLFSSRQ